MSSTELPETRTADTAPATPLPRAVRVADGEELRSVALPGLSLTVRSRPGARA
ncbi:alpha/beta hydrolase, partial [Streptomyces hydrogenans]